MELQTAIEILEYHQEWRLGKREAMIHEPKKITEAFDIVLSDVKKIRLGDVSVRSEQFKCEKCGSDWGEVRATCFNCNHESEDLST